eukprot:EG_transcript_35396
MGEGRDSVLEKSHRGQQEIYGGSELFKKALGGRTLPALKGGRTDQPSGEEANRLLIKFGLVDKIAANATACHITRPRHAHIVSSMMALTMSPSLFSRARAARCRDTLAWLITSSRSFGSTVLASTSSPSSSSTLAAGGCAAASGAKDWTAFRPSSWAMSSILASPSTT